MKKLKFVLLATAGLLLGGCSTVAISSKGSLNGVDVKGAAGKADQAIMVANEGYYLFQCWPLVSGSTEWDSRRREIRDDISFFSNEIVGDKMINAMFNYANSRDCDLTDIVINNRCTCNIGLFGLLDWFNTIVGYQAVTYSGVLRPRN